MKLIDGDALADRLLSDAITNDQRRQANYIRKVIEEMPSAQPERKRGKWIRHTEIKNVYGGICIECSECGEKYVVQHIEDEKFCRNCGSDCREGGAE